MQKFQAQRPIENTQKRIHEDVHELSTNMSIESSKNQFHKSSVLWSRIIVAYFFWWAKEIDYEPPEPKEIGTPLFEGWENTERVSASGLIA